MEARRDVSRRRIAGYPATCKRQRQVVEGDMWRVFFWGLLVKTVCRQCLIPSIIRSLRVAFHLQLATVPSWEDLSVEQSLENSFGVDSSSFSHPSSFVGCRSQLNVCMCKDHLVSPLQVCFKLNASWSQTIIVNSRLRHPSFLESLPASWWRPLSGMRAYCLPWSLSVAISSSA